MVVWSVPSAAGAVAPSALRCCRAASGGAALRGCPLPCGRRGRSVALPAAVPRPPCRGPAPACPPAVVARRGLCCVVRSVLVVWSVPCGGVVVLRRLPAASARFGYAALCGRRPCR